MYPTILQMVIDAIVWATLMEVCDPQEDYNILGWAAGGAGHGVL